MSHLRRRTDRDLHIKWDKLLLYWTNLTKGKPFCGLGTFISCLGAQKSTFWQKGAQKPHFFLRGPSNRTRGGAQKPQVVLFFLVLGGGPKNRQTTKIYTPVLMSPVVVRRQHMNIRLCTSSPWMSKWLVGTHPTMATTLRVPIPGLR